MHVRAARRSKLSVPCSDMRANFFTMFIEEGEGYYTYRCVGTLPPSKRYHGIKLLKNMVLNELRKSCSGFEILSKP